MKDKSRIPRVQRLKKLLFNIIGRPYFYVDMRFDSKTNMMMTEFDYNSPMLNRLIDAGYQDDGDEPDRIVRRYIQTVMTQTDLEEDDDLFEDEESYDEDDEPPKYVYERYK
tara:strand:+ start:1535 stop:1867 length:333 start_codon:yes stop_codon:yes gene_type:complete